MPRPAVWLRLIGESLPDLPDLPDLSLDTFRGTEHLLE